MGYSKKLYNVLGGVTSIIIACTTNFDYSQNSQILQKCIFVFVDFSQKQFVQYYQIYETPSKTFSYTKSASNSSLLIFSFSNRSLAQL